MKDELVSKKVFLLLLEKGFEQNIDIPTQTRATKWLREVHNIYILIIPIMCHIIPENIVGYNFEIKGKVFADPDDTYGSYKSALEGALLEALKSITI
jgi:hypothetical protein